jgi:D-sedoheptulose 7-phosphate isomerase
MKQYASKIARLTAQFNNDDLTNAASHVADTINKKGKIIIAGNGGSAAMASHVSVDFLKAAKIRCMNFNEADLITCYANDYGYENWITKALESYLDCEDTVILISSSGTSCNIINAANYCLSRGVKLITLTGFEANNSVSLLGSVNVWCDSKVYNYIEMAHHIWLVALVDHFANGKKVL